MSNLFVKGNTNNDDFDITSLTIEYINNNQQTGGNKDNMGLTEAFEDAMVQFGGMYDNNMQNNNLISSVTSDFNPNIDNLILSATSEQNGGMKDSETTDSFDYTQEGGNNTVNTFSVSSNTELTDIFQGINTSGGNMLPKIINKQVGGNVESTNESELTDVFKGINTNTGNKLKSIAKVSNNNTKKNSTVTASEQNTSELENNLQELFKEIQKGGSLSKK